ncbi:hypothetical protein B0J17DRAFT_683037 [Rhizoctonia solani]|nr:hypothetical protein B0J17DRAFT_683037 [Rhizoctonia solani]
MKLAAQKLDKLLYLVKFLKLCKVLSLPIGHVYARPVELRLEIYSSGRMSVCISQLTEVLSYCPRLRVFHFNLEIKSEDPKVPISPVQLRELEVLHLRGIFPPYVEKLLAHISPGPKPLDLYLPIDDDILQPPDVFLQASIRDFFARSRVTRLFLEKYEWSRRDGRFYVPFSRMLSELPASLCALGLARMGIMFEFGDAYPSYPAQLSALTIYSCDFETYALKMLAMLYPIRELKSVGLVLESYYGIEDETRRSMALLIPVVDMSRHPPQGWESSMTI